MNFNIKESEKELAQIASAISDLVVNRVQENDGVDIGDIEQGMRQLLQEIGRQAMEQVLEKQDPIEANIRCPCQQKANYRSRREGMVITVFGRVRYKRRYYLCDHCGRGEKALDTQLKIQPGEVSRGLKPLLALLGIQT